MKMYLLKNNNWIISKYCYKVVGIFVPVVYVNTFVIIIYNNIIISILLF